MDDVRKSKMLSRSAVPSRLTRLQERGISCEKVGGDQYLIDGAFVYQTAIGNWRSVDYRAAGYTLASLFQAIEERRAQRCASRKPAVGRDNTTEPAEVETYSPAGHATDSDRCVESTAGRSLKTVWP